ncbi:MAG: hypothetical protein AAB229_04450 [Candidatus Hydrogenedentota bacterium]
MNSGEETYGQRCVRIYTIGLLVLALHLGVAHLLFPRYTWGQGRDSWFNFDNSLTFASWLIAILLVVAAIIARWLHVKSCSPGEAGGAENRILPVCSVLLLLLSICEITRLATRLEWMGLNYVDAWGGFHWFHFLRGPAFLMVVGPPFLFLFHDEIRKREETARVSHTLSAAWFATWTASLLLHLAPYHLRGDAKLYFSLLKGETFLCGAILLVGSLGRLAAAPRVAVPPEEKPAGSAPIGIAIPDRSILAGIFASAYTVVSLELILAQMLLVSGNYVSSSAAISIALLGIAIGGAAGSLAPFVECDLWLRRAAMVTPIMLILALGPAAAHGEWPFMASLFLMPAFALPSMVITLGLRRLPAHLAYFTDLAGAALAAATTNILVANFLEEGAVLALAALGAFTALVLSPANGRPSFSRKLMRAAVPVALLALAFLVSQHSFLSMTRARIAERYPRGSILHTASTLAGRIDIARRKPKDDYLKVLENGRIIDTIRPLERTSYEIDPRLPYGFFDSPSVLIVGLSVEGVTKTAVNAGGIVDGVEINPAVVRLMDGPLARASRRCYDGINVSVMDGRTFLDRSDTRYDFITLLNAHFSRGTTRGREPVPEYLHTVDAARAYFSHLTDRGFLVIEEPIGMTAAREAPVWKILSTLRQGLLDRGADDPARHVLAFLWTTPTNAYVQILVKTSPVSDSDVVKFDRWIEACNGISAAGDSAGRRLGPLKDMTLLPLYVPGRPCPHLTP